MTGTREKDKDLIDKWWLCCVVTRWTYADPSWARIAALVPVVVTCAEDGDDVANQILNDAVEELALTVKAVVHKLGLCGQGMSITLLLIIFAYYNNTPFAKSNIKKLILQWLNQ